MQKSIYSNESDAFLNWLVTKRKDAGLTIRQLAEKLDIHPSIVGKIETGERRLDVIELVYYCRALDVPPQQGIEIIEKALR